MLHSMQEQNAEDAVAEPDLRDKLLEQAAEKFGAGDFKAAKEWLDASIDDAVEETAVLKPVRDQLKLDRAAVIVAIAGGLVILLLAVFTLFH